MFVLEYAVAGEEYTRTRGRSPVREVVISMAQRLVVKHGPKLDWIEIVNDEDDSVVYEWVPEGAREGGLGAAA